MRELLSVLNALAEPNRLRLLMCLDKQELCVCNLVDLIQLADSTVSKHMSILRQAGLVEMRKKGRWVYYRLADQDALPLVVQALEFTRLHLKSDAIVAQDAERLAEILGRDDGTRCQPVAASCEKDSTVNRLETV